MSPDRELFTRSPANPILSAADWPYPVNSVFNPGATIFDGETLLLCRVEDQRGISHLTVARSQDGIGGWRIDPEPLLPATITTRPPDGVSRIPGSPSSRSCRAGTSRTPPTALAGRPSRWRRRETSRALRRSAS